MNGDGPHKPQLWSYEGATLEAGNGWVSTADLLEFAQFVHVRYPNERVLLHQWGLRVTTATGEGGPRLEWRDWD